MLKNGKLLLGVVAGLLSLATAHAANVTPTDSMTLVQTSKVEVGAFVGYMAGTSREYVFDTTLVSPTGEHPLASKLNWRINNAATAGLNVIYRPLPWLAIRGNAWSVVASNGRVTDYDWTMRESDVNSWSDRSIAPLDRMNRAYGADLGAVATLYRAERLTIDGLAGYRYKTLKFVASDSGMDYVYSGDGSDPSMFRQQVGHLSGRTLAYKQQWRAAYLGLGLHYDLGKFALMGEMSFSPWVYGKDRDNHFQRDLLFHERGERSSMIGVEAGANYSLSQRWSLFARVNYEKYSTALADSWVTNLATGEKTWTPTGSAGLSSETWGINLGVKASF